MSDNIQRIVIELAARGIGAALRAAQSIKRVADQSLPLRGRGVSSVFSGRFGRASKQQTWPNAKLRSPLLPEEGGAPTDLGGVGENAVRLFRLAREEDRLVEDLRLSLPEETSLLTTMTRFPSDETSVASVSAAIPMTDSDESQPGIERQSRASFHPSREVVTHIDSTAQHKFWLPAQLARMHRHLSGKADGQLALSQVGAQGVMSDHRITPSSPLTPAWRVEERGEEIHRLIPKQAPPIQHLHTQLEPVDLQGESTLVSRFPNDYREHDQHALPLKLHESRSPSLNELEPFSETSSEAFLIPQDNDHPSFHPASSSAILPGVLETNYLAHRRRKPELVASTEKTQARVAASTIDSDDSNRPTPSVAPLQSAPAENHGRSESFGLTFQSNDMEARLESMFRLQEERFKSMIKNLAYWLK